MHPEPVRKSANSRTDATAVVSLAQQDPRWVRWSLTGIAVTVVVVLIVIPVINVFAEALAEGAGVYWKNLFADPDTRHSILLTLTVVPTKRDRGIHAPLAILPRKLPDLLGRQIPCTTNASTLTAA